MNEQISTNMTTEEATLREAVERAMLRYFETLEGETPTGIYAMWLAETEAPLLKATLDYAGGNQRLAAEMLGINRGTLRTKLRAYNLIK